MISLNLSASPSGSGPDYSYAFQPVSRGDAAVVTVSVPNAPSTASWSIFAGGHLIGTVVGPNGIGDIYIANGAAVTITGTSPIAPGDAVLVGMEGSVSEVPVTSPSPSAGVVNVGAEVTVNGTVDATVSGSVEANITNASIPISGSVDANITNATLTVDGTVSLAANQVVEVTNESGGSLTVAGQVDVGSVSGTVTIDANGSDVTVDAVGMGALLGTIPADTTSAQFTVAAGVNSLIITPIAEVPVTTVTVSVAVSGTNVYLPTAITVNSDGSKSVVCQTLVPGTYTVTLSQQLSTPVYVFTSTGVQDIRAAISEPLVQPTVYPNGQTFLQRYALLGNAENVATEIFSTSISTDSYMRWYTDNDGGTLLIWTPVTITSVVDLSGASWPFRLVAIGSSYYVYAVPLAAAGSFPTQAPAPTYLFTINFSSTSSSSVAVAHIQGKPFLPKLPVQTIVMSISSNYATVSPAFPHKVKAVSFELAVAASTSAVVLLGLNTGASLGPPGVFSGTSGSAFSGGSGGATFYVSMSADAPSVQTNLAGVFRAQVPLAGADIPWPAGTEHTLYWPTGTVSNAYLLAEPL